MFKNKEQQFDFYWKEIFNGLAYNPIEFNTYRFDQTMSLPGKVNKLYELFKVLAMNNQEVMDYLKVFVETFDFKLETTVEDVLEVWLNDGRLSDIVREAISEEVIEARNGYDSLKERLDTEYHCLENKMTTEHEVFQLELERIDKEVAANDKKLSLNNIYLRERKENEVDDTLRIQEALNELKVKGGTLFLPNEVLKISQTLYLKDNQNFKIQGSGVGTTITTDENITLFELGDTINHLWNEGLKTVGIIENVIFKGNYNNKHGLHIHSVGSQLINCEFNQNGLTGLLAPGVGYLRITGCRFYENKIGFYLHWACFLNRVHCTRNYFVGGYLGGACDMTNSLIEWQCPDGVCGEKITGLIVSCPDASQTKLTNNYFEQDLYYVGHEKTLDYKTATFKEGVTESGYVVFEGNSFSNQSLLYAHSGSIHMSNNRFAGIYFGIYTWYTQEGYINKKVNPPKIYLSDLNTFVSINGGSGGYFYLDKTQNNQISNPCFYGIQKINSGNNSLLSEFYGWETKNTIWNSGDFNVTIEQTNHVPEESTARTSAKYKVNNGRFSSQLPILYTKFNVTKGVKYYLSMDAKATHTFLYYTKGLESEIYYTGTDYKLTGNPINFSSVGRKDNQWCRRIVEFVAQKTETIELGFQCESKTVGAEMYLTNVCISESPKLNAVQKGVFKGEIPQTGYWNIGDVVYNENIGVEDRIEKWYRLTNGTNHTFNQDWMGL